MFLQLVEPGSSFWTPSCCRGPRDRMPSMFSRPASSAPFRSPLTSRWASRTARWYGKSRYGIKIAPGSPPEDKKAQLRKAAGLFLYGCRCDVAGTVLYRAGDIQVQLGGLEPSTSGSTIRLFANLFKLLAVPPEISPGEE